jgi:maleate isomerase
MARQDSEVTRSHIAESVESAEAAPAQTLESTARAAIGLVAPFDLELDRELWRWMPDSVDLLITRTPRTEDTAVTVDFVRELAEPGGLADAVRAVTAGRAEVVAYACTSASFVNGPAGEAKIRTTMEAAGAHQAVTTSGAILEALAALGAARVALVTPYLEDLSELFVEFLSQNDIEVVQHLAMGEQSEIWNVSYARTTALVQAADRDDADAIVLACTNLPSFDLIAELERELGKPVISANQATMWAALGRLGQTANGPEQALIART